MIIPTQPHEPVMKLEQSSMLLYGPPKIGKSTFCSHAPDPLFLATERGVDHLRVRSIPIHSLADMMEAIDALETQFRQKKTPCQTLVIDTIDNLIGMIDFEVAQMEDKRFVASSDIGFGRGKPRVKAHFRNLLIRIQALPCGLWMTSHTAQTKPDKSGNTRTVSSLPPEYRDIVNGAVDMILYADDHEYKNDEGKLVSKPAIYTRKTGDIEAGCRSATMPPIIPLNYAALKTAYEGKKETTK